VRAALWDLFRRRLAELDHAQGEDIGFEFRFAHGRSDRAAEAAAELAGLPVDVLVTAGTPAVEAGRRATRDIPIVMATGTALAGFDGGRAGNVTGVTDLPPGLSARRLALLRDAVAPAARLAILADHDNPSSPPAVRETQAAAGPLAANVADYWVHGPGDFDAVLSVMSKDGIGGFVVAPGAMFFAHRGALAGRAIAHRLATMTVRREYAEAGALLSYGASIADNYRRAAETVDRILRGARPSELAIGSPTAFEFVVNLKTAGALGLAVPQALLSRAETIER
jgi:putative ABC transport system substrate-binding protein